MRIRLDRELPPRFVAALGFSCLLFLAGAFVASLVDSCRGWVATYFVKQVARIHFNRGRVAPYLDLLPPRESIRFDPLDRKFIVEYNITGSWTADVIIRDDGSVWIPQPPVE